MGTLQLEPDRPQRRTTAGKIPFLENVVSDLDLWIQDLGMSAVSHGPGKSYHDEFDQNVCPCIPETDEKSPKVLTGPYLIFSSLWPWPLTLKSGLENIVIFSKISDIIDIFNFYRVLKIFFNVTHCDYFLIFSLCVLLAYDLCPQHFLSVGQLLSHCTSPQQCSVNDKSTSPNMQSTHTHTIIW